LKDGAAALSWACHHGHLKVAKMLVDGGAEIDAEDGVSSTRIIMREGFR
jgi:ankyrin repeat protein